MNLDLFAYSVMCIQHIEYKHKKTKQIRRKPINQTDYGPFQFIFCVFFKWCIVADHILHHIWGQPNQLTTNTNVWEYRDADQKINNKASVRIIYNDLEGLFFPSFFAQKASQPWRSDSNTTADACCNAGHKCSAGRRQTSSTWRKSTTFSRQWNVE